MQNILNIVAHHTFLKIVSPYNNVERKHRYIVCDITAQWKVKVRKDNENRKEKLF